MKKILVCGAGGFIGAHLVKYLSEQGHNVHGVDLKYPQWSTTYASNFDIIDLRDQYLAKDLLSNNFDEIYQLAADMGGAGYIFTGENDAKIVTNSAQINLNIAKSLSQSSCKKLFFTSSACIYPLVNQQSTSNPNCSEHSAYPAMPDSEYGWEKLFSERLYLSYARTLGIDIKIARLHNVYGPLSHYVGGREKSVTAICRKVIESDGIIEIWGTGNQTRTFLYVDDCVDGIDKIMKSNITIPVNLGSDRLISINDLAQMIIDFSKKSIIIRNVAGPEGVRGRTSDNTLIKKLLNWAPPDRLAEGVQKTFNWVKEQIHGTN